MLRSGFRGTALAVIAYGVAMAFLEAAVVVYVRAALAIAPDAIFPLRYPGAFGDLAAIEVGRELATLAMLAAIGWIAGRSGIERLTWSAVAFGAWDIAYYGWLVVISGWPPALDAWDILFLVPVPWVGPVWAPIVVSVALVAFGLWAARRRREGRPIPIGPWRAALGVAGGLLVVVSFTLDAPRIMAGGLPGAFPWPFFAAGMLLALGAALSALRATPD